MAAIKTIKERTTGEVRIAGTLHQVRDELQRHEYSGDVSWIIVRGICNGTGHQVTTYKTRKAALAAWEV